MAKYDFPKDGPLSFRQLKADAEDAGCDVTLRHRATQMRAHRAAVLVIRGVRCREAFASSCRTLEELAPPVVVFATALR